MEEYCLAIEEIEKLVDVDLDSPEGDKLVSLCLAVQDFEEEVLGLPAAC